MSPEPIARNRTRDDNRSSRPGASGLSVDAAAHALGRLGGPPVPTTSYLNQPEIIDAVAPGEVLAGSVTDPYVGWFLKQRPGAVRISSAPMPPEFRWNVAVRLLNADPPLLSAFNDSRDRIIADQTSVGIFAKYGMTYVPPRA